MKTVTKIEASQPVLKPKKRVAAYARVSMETERLQHSLSAQVSYYNAYIQKNPDWLFAGVYSDNGISGTGTAGRESFNRLISDCDAGKIDIVLTKSISRFARNTVDLLETVRHLRDIGVEVWFEKENIHSFDGDGELMLSILASFAQEESRSISENVKWGTRKRFEQGIPNGHMRIYGYRWEGDSLIPVPEEAAVVRRIFQNFLDGKSRLETERELAAEGITTREGCRWVDSNIKLVLTNITYTGNLLLQKEYISDPISKRRKKNRGELPQYFVEGHHEPIIDPTVFEFVQEEMARRRELGALANKSLNITCFTGKLKCPHCGVSLMHCRNGGRGNHGTEDYWKCGTAKKKGGRCPVKGGIRDDKLREACARALGTAEFDEQAFLERVDYISVPERYTVEIHMRDGSIVPETCIPTGHKDCWTPEYRAATSEKRRRHGTNPKGATCFTGRIKCGGCGCNYRAETSGKMRYWRCGTNRDGIPLREDVLQEVTAQVLGLDAFDENVVTARLDSIFVQGDTLVFRFLDGHEEQRTWVKPNKRGRKHTEEEKEHMRQVMREKWTPEKKAAMSESMKQLRRERGSQWRK